MLLSKVWRWLGPRLEGSRQSSLKIRPRTKTIPGREPCKSSPVGEDIQELERELQAPRSNELVTLRALLADVPLQVGGSSGLPVLVHAHDSTAYGVGDVLLDVDREVRRSVSFLRSQRLTGVELDASSLRRRGLLELASAERTSSIDILLIALGAVYEILLSDPVQLAITVSWFFERRLWRRGTHKPADPTPASIVGATVKESAIAAVTAGHAVAFKMNIDERGRCSTEFVSLPPGAQPRVTPRN